MNGNNIKAITIHNILYNTFCIILIINIINYT